MGGILTESWLGGAKGRPHSRWRYEVLHDLKKPKLRNWNLIVKDRQAWNDLAHKTKFQTPYRDVVSEEEEETTTKEEEEEKKNMPCRLVNMYQRFVSA